jgi:hypothetical protein
MASTKGISGAGILRFANPAGKNIIKASQSYKQPSNPVPGHKRLECLTGNSKASQASQNSYAGKSASSSGFANSRARELGSFKGSVPVSGLRHTKKPETKNQIKP